ncbi:MAG TPA: hypothetical protein VEQ38_22535, partial [Verrucomicrobiae bacterium]|nr:hypothetical protein [Verrucomicrobiae bacterium]
IKSFYQRKKAKTKAVVAIKAVAHKLCRACYHIMKDRVAFDVTKAFGPLTLWFSWKKSSRLSVFPKRINGADF